MNWMWRDDQQRLDADIDRYWQRQHKLASGWQPWWRRLAAWLARANRRG